MRSATTMPADTTRAVDEFLRALDHPFKSEIETMRKIILGAHPTVSEGTKWNAPSFRTTEYFATHELRVKGCVGVILHLGAKVRATAVTGVPIGSAIRS
jgi:hypothetical protein